MTMPVLGVPSLEESYLSLTNQSSARGQAGCGKEGRGAPARKIGFGSLVAYGPKVFLLSLSHGGLQLLKPGRAVPNKYQYCQFVDHTLHSRSLKHRKHNQRNSSWELSVEQ